MILISSVWQQNTSLPSFPQLQSDCKTDVLIIGGGVSGILTAYFLHKRGVNYILVEGDKIAHGVSKNTTAKITILHSLIYEHLIRNFGQEFAKLYLESNKNALLEYKNLCNDIDCDFEILPAITYSTSGSSIKIENEIRALELLGETPQFLKDIPIPINISGAIKIDNQAQFNPLKFISHISQDLNIFENTFIKTVDNLTAYSSSCKINAKKIIFATHFPFINSHGSYFLKMYQHRSYVLGIETPLNINGMYVDESETGLSFRKYKDLLLIGGGSHRTGTRGGGYPELRNFVKTYFPNSPEKFSWSNQDCITLDDVPYIGMYSKHTPNWFVSTGFNKWGMTSSMVSAQILSDLVLGKRNDYVDIFSPSRSILKPQLFVNIGHTLTNFIFPSTKRCSHLGCALKWNKLEHSWDCPCHGSRFDCNGNIIDNPANKNAHV